VLVTYGILIQEDWMLGLRGRLLIIQVILMLTIDGGRFINNGLVVQVYIEKELGLVLFQDVNVFAPGAAPARFEDAEGIFKRVF